MKKKLFNQWYESIGKDLAKSSLPIDEVNEKEIKNKAKNIFSSVYNLINNEICDRLSYINLDIFRHQIMLTNLQNEYESSLLKLKIEKESINRTLTSVYNSYYNQNMNKEDFQKIKSELIPRYLNLKSDINVNESLIRLGKKEKRIIESLLVVDNEY